MKPRTNMPNANRMTSRSNRLVESRASITDAPSERDPRPSRDARGRHRVASPNPCGQQDSRSDPGADSTDRCADRADCSLHLRLGQRAVVRLERETPGKALLIVLERGAAVDVEQAHRAKVGTGRRTDRFADVGRENGFRDDEREIAVRPGIAGWSAGPDVCQAPAGKPGDLDLRDD